MMSDYGSTYSGPGAYEPYDSDDHRSECSSRGGYSHKRDNCTESSYDSCKSETSCATSKKESCPPKYYPPKCPPKCPPKRKPKCHKPKVRGGGRWPPRSCNYADMKNIGPATADPVTISVGKGGTFCTIDEAMTRLSKRDENRRETQPVNGYRVILQHGKHRLKKDYHTDINVLRFEAQSWHPSMGMSYIQGAGHAQGIIADTFQQYDSKVGGLGKWELEVCGSMVTVCGSTNPDFSGLFCGDILYWLNKKGKVNCYTVSKGLCNQIWIQECFNFDCIEDGEGFWIGNRVQLEPEGSRLLRVQDRIEYLGITVRPAGSGSSISTKAEDEETVREGNRFLTGADGGYVQFSHGMTNERVSFVGDFDCPQPNIHTSLNHYFPENSGYWVFQSFLGANSKCHIEGSSVSHFGSTYVASQLAAFAFDNGKFASIGSCFMKCTTGVRNWAASTNYYGTMFDSCHCAAEAARNGHVTSRNQSFAGLPPPLFRFCDIAILLLDKAQGDSQTLLTQENGIDLRLDGDDFDSFSDYTSGTQGSQVSSLWFEDHFEADNEGNF